MGRPNITARKVRVLVDQVITADGPLPAFPTGPDANDRVVFLGDFKGAEILGFEFTSGAFTDITALDCNIEHSLDGANWHVLKALVQKLGAACTLDDLDDGDPEPLRYLRANFSATGNYGQAAGVKIKIAFRQVGAKGAFAPPGVLEVLH